MTRGPVLAIAILVVTMAIALWVSWSTPDLAGRLNGACRDHGGVTQIDGRRAVCHDGKVVEP